MKKFAAGLAMGLTIGLSLSVSPILFAGSDIRLIINGKDITPLMDVKPQNIDGRILVPARYVAENLEAKVEWDSSRQEVIITSDGKGLPGSSAPDYLAPLEDNPHRSSEELDEIYRAELAALELKITYKGTAFVIIDRYTEDIVYSISGGNTENLVRAYLKQELQRKDLI
ncbi:MAG: copper amine oxidase N-terminal domain-containing protein [Clostridiales bacterium]